MLYFDSVYAAINSCVRSLLNIINGRDANFKDVDALKDIYTANAQALETFSANLQSSFGQLASITFGGTSATAIVAYYFLKLPIFIFPLVINCRWCSVICGSQTVYCTLVAKKNVKANIRTDYQRDLYYQQYVRASKDALKGLFTETLDLYNEVYGVSYDTKYDDPKTIEALINNLMESIDFKKYACPKIYKCYANGKKFNQKDLAQQWSNCESGEGTDGCQFFKEGAQVIGKA